MMKRGRSCATRVPGLLILSYKLLSAASERRRCPGLRPGFPRSPNLTGKGSSGRQPPPLRALSWQKLGVGCVVSENNVLFLCSTSLNAIPRISVPAFPRDGPSARSCGLSRSRVSPVGRAWAQAKARPKSPKVPQSAARALQAYSNGSTASYHRSEKMSRLRRRRHRGACGDQGVPSS